MTIKEYREKHPNCQYCKHRVPPFDICLATDKIMGKSTAKRCPCYIPEEWKYERSENDA